MLKLLSHPHRQEKRWSNRLITWGSKLGCFFACTDNFWSQIHLFLRQWAQYQTCLNKFLTKPCSHMWGSWLGSLLRFNCCIRSFWHNGGDKLSLQKSTQLYFKQKHRIQKESIRILFYSKLIDSSKLNHTCMRSKMLYLQPCISLWYHPTHPLNPTTCY